MKQVEQSYRTGELKVGEVPVPLADERGILVATSVSLISSGTEKQLMDLAKASLAGKALARPDLVRTVVRNMRRNGIGPTIEKVLTKLDTPIPLGYSLSGVVLEVGHHTSGFSVGDRVACAGAGFANHAEVNFVPKHLAAQIPANVDDHDASFVTLGAIALQGVRQAGVTLGERVVVIGLGLIGLLTVQLLKASGCRVIGFDPNEERVTLARGLGADVAISDGLSEVAREFSGGHGADAVIITASSKSSEPLNHAAEISRHKGRIVVVGLVGMAIDREPFYKRELDLRLSMSYGPGRHDPSYEMAGHDYPLPYVRWTEQRNMTAFLGLVAEGKVTPKSLVTHKFDISEALKAYGVMERGEPHLAMLLTYPGLRQTDIRRRIARVTKKIVNSRNQVAFIGLGNYGRSVLLPALMRVGGVTLNTVVTATGISAAHASQKYGFAVAATDPHTAIHDNDIDTVFIATRHNTHASLTIAALRAGKHVFCEKPLAISEAELAQIDAPVREGRGILTVGFNRRFAPLLLKAKAALQPRAGPVTMVYRINAGAIPSESWANTAEGGGRVVGEVCHFVDTLTYLVDSYPVDVHAVLVRDHTDAASALIRFADGSTGAIVYTPLGDPSVPKEYIEVFAAGRVVQLEDFAKLVVTSGGKRVLSKARQDKGQAGLVKAFIEATRGIRSAPIPVSDLIVVSAATLAIAESLRVGNTVEVSACSPAQGDEVRTLPEQRIENQG